MTRLLLAAAVLAGLAAALLLGLPGRSVPRGGGAGGVGGTETGLFLASLLGDTAAGFRKVLGPRPFVFPADHGPHPEYHSEWWYFTGNLEDTLGRRFGYQLTFFRSGLRPPDSGAGNGRSAGRTSAWAADQAFMAHFALTEAGSEASRGGHFHAFERFSRGALGLAGAEAAPFRVWLEDWSTAGGGDTSLFPLKLRASQGGVSLDLVLVNAKPLAVQGDRGFSRKGPEPGNASHYYSFTRMPTRGSVTTPDGHHTVTGASWMDREWGSSILSPGLAGWEWFGLQLEDGTDWLFFRLRGTGTADAARDSVRFDYGMRIGPEGGTRVLKPEDIEAVILSRWTSPRGRVYPARWRISVPSESLVLDLEPLQADQELDLSIPYWEGAVEVRGERAGQRVAGRGYMELTGY